MVAFSQDMHDLYNDKLIGAERCIIASIEYQHNGCVEWRLGTHNYYNYLLRLTQRVAYISGTFDSPVVQGSSASSSETVYVVGCLLASAVS